MRGAGQEEITQSASWDSDPGFVDIQSNLLLPTGLSRILR